MKKGTENTSFKLRNTRIDHRYTESMETKEENRYPRATEGNSSVDKGRKGRDAKQKVAGATGTRAAIARGISKPSVLMPNRGRKMRTKYRVVFSLQKCVGFKNNSRNTGKLLPPNQIPYRTGDATLGLRAPRRCDPATAVDPTRRYQHYRRK